MAFWLTIAYIVLGYLTPEEMLPAIAPYRPMLCLAILAVVASAFSALGQGSRALRTRQAWLMLGLIAAVVLSQVSHFYFGGVLNSLQNFLPSAIVFFLVILNVRTWRQLKIALVSVNLCAAFMLSQTLWAYTHNPNPGVDSELIMAQRVFQGDTYVETLDRIRYLGTLGDPNDFAQFLLVNIAFLGMWWKKGRAVSNTFCVLLPCAFFVLGIYLTHSRGGLLAFLLLPLVVLRRKLGSVGAAISAALLAIGAAAVSFTGNRGISVSEGSDRLSLWSEGLQGFKQSPIFGIGYRQFDELTGSLTAHNSFVLCFTELGIVGFFFWLGLVVLTVMELGRLIPTRQQQALSAGATSGGTDGVTRDAAFDGQKEGVAANAAQWSRTLRLALLMFLATSWFLSRTYAATLYLLIGLGLAAVELARAEALTSDVPAGAWLKATFGAMVATAVGAWIAVKLL